MSDKVFVPIRSCHECPCYEALDFGGPGGSPDSFGCHRLHREVKTGEIDPECPFRAENQKPEQVWKTVPPFPTYSGTVVRIPERKQPVSIVARTREAAENEAMRIAHDTDFNQFTEEAWYEIRHLVKDNT